MLLAPCVLEDLNPPPSCVVMVGKGKVRGEGKREKKMTVPLRKEA